MEQYGNSIHKLCQSGFLLYISSLLTQRPDERSDALRHQPGLFGCSIMPTGREHGSLTQISVHSKQCPWPVKRVSGQHSNSSRYADLRVDIVDQLHRLGKGGGSTKKRCADKTVGEPVQRQICQKRVLITLGLYLSIAVAPCTASEEYPCSQPNRAIMQRPGKSL